MESSTYSPRTTAEILARARHWQSVARKAAERGDHALASDRFGMSVDLYELAVAAAGKVAT